MDQIHPELQAHFANQQREQQRYIQTAIIGRNVRQSRDAAFALLDKYVERGLQMDEGAMRADALVRESERFTQEARGVSRFFYCMCIPRWWFDCTRHGGSAL